MFKLIGKDIPKLMGIVSFVDTEPKCLQLMLGILSVIEVKINLTQPVSGLLL